MDRINLEEKFAQVGEHWPPKLIGELNGQYVKLAKGRGNWPGTRMRARTIFFW